jgi:hypothetical protein
MILPKLTSNHIKVLSVLSLVLLEGLAIFKGQDGAYFGLVISACAGLGGYELGSTRLEHNVIDEKREEKDNQE